MENKTAAVSDLLQNCKLDGSTVVYVDSEDENEGAKVVKSDLNDDTQEEVVEGFVLGESEVEVAQDNPEIGANGHIMPVVNFEDENGEDGAGALKDGIQAVAKINWDDNDLKYIFKKLEIAMAAAGAKKQYTKFQIVSTIIPKHVEDEVKSLLELQETEFEQNNAYKLLKSEIMRIFGPKPTKAIDRALTRTLTGKPSILARALVNDINKKFDCESCHAVVQTLWTRQLPSAVRAGIAHMAFNKETFNAVTQLADDIFETQSAAVNAMSVAAVSQDAFNETQPGLQYPVPEVAAFGRGGSGRGGRGRGRGRGGRGNRGGSSTRGGSAPATNTPAPSQSQARYKGPKHPDLPQGEWTGCQLHYKWGRSAHFCAEPLTCPWKNIFTPKPARNN